MHAIPVAPCCHSGPWTNDCTLCLVVIVHTYRMLRQRRGLAAVGKLTEIVEVENETWQGAKFGVC